MKRFWSALAILALFFGTTPVRANGTASHTVRVVVEPINEVSLEGGDLTLTIDSAVAGAQPDEAVDSNVRLLWTTNERNRKIIVETDRTSTAFRLTIEAKGVTGGTSAGPVVLGSTPRDLVVGISNTVGSADLHYAASATTEAGAGREVHTVSFTITAAN